MGRSDEGLRSEAMKAALDEALAGKTTRLEDLLARHGAMPSPRPNLKLAAAFGAEVGALPGKLAPLLTRLAGDDSAPDQARVFLPIAAAHGFAGRIREGNELPLSWRALCELAGDERAPVRVGTLDALVALAARAGGADSFVTHAHAWIEETEDREIKFGSAALALEALSDARVMSTLRDHEALFAYLSRVVDEVADAPRAAERSDGRRRVLVSISGVFAAIVGHLSRGEAGVTFFLAEAERAEHPDVRESLSQAIQKLRASSQGARAALIDDLQKSLAESAKPLRYAALVRPGTGRGKKTRRTR